MTILVLRSLAAALVATSLSLAFGKGGADESAISPAFVSCPIEQCD